MIIVAIAWIYVVGLMALTEVSVIGGIMTFLLYCVLPLSILFYLTGGKGRRARRMRDAHAAAPSDNSIAAPDKADTGPTGRPDSA